MSKLKTTPKKGDIVRADYVISGKVKKKLDLGTVAKVNKSKKTIITEKDGVQVERALSFGVKNGVRILGFYTEEKETEEKTED